VARTTKWWWVVVVLGVAVALRQLLWTPRAIWQVTNRLVVSVRYGGGLTDVGRWTGLDGTEYGPLSFAIADGRVAIIDTYHHRVMWRALGGGHRRWTVRSVPESLLADIAWDPDRGGWLVADNNSRSIWLVRRTSSQPALTLPVRSGTTLAWEQLFATHGSVYVAWTRVGQGLLESGLSQYRPNGRAHLVAAWGQTRTGEWAPALPVLIRVPAVAYTVSPGGRIYVEVPGTSPHRIELMEFGATGNALAKWSVTIQDTIESSELVGAAEGRVYLGVNVGVLGQQGLVYETRAGHPAVLQLVLPSPREVLHTYVRVGPGDTLYWAVSKGQTYQIWSRQRRQVLTGGFHL
jgi:hypothetical protein